MYRRGKVIFRNQSIRCVWVTEKAAWFYSPIDFVKACKETRNPGRYWSDQKRRKKIISNELYANCVKLRLDSKDGKKMPTDMVTPLILEKIGLCVGLAGNHNFNLWINHLKIWSTVKDSWITHRKMN